MTKSLTARRPAAAPALVLFLLAIAHLTGCGTAATTGSPANETILLIRHGEKPAAGLGQLNCQGLNRALALPAVIEKNFGKPDAIFAPDPSHRVSDNKQLYNYIRPLATVEPTAIAFGLPVNAGFGYTDISGLVSVLKQADAHRALTLVAWEHGQIETIARDLIVGYGGDPSGVPKWRDDDFDSIYIIKIARSDRAATVSFTTARQGLDGQPTICPR